MYTVCVFLTGEWRTIETCLPSLLHYLVHSPGFDVHVFACLHSPEKDLQTSRLSWLKIQLGNHLRGFSWFDPHSHPFSQVLQSTVDTLQQKQVAPNMVDYLAHRSGSLLEYYQSYLCWKLMTQYEQENAMTYDYLVRTRTDVMLCRPLLSWLYWSMSDWETHWNRIVGLDGFRDAVTWREAMNSLVRPGPFRKESSLLLPSMDPLVHNWMELRLYALQGEYALTYRKNIVYVMRRRLYTPEVAALGIEYGQVRMPGNDYWFDAESQWQTRLHWMGGTNGLAVFDSVLPSEGDSLYHYSPENYFDGSGAVRKDFPGLFFLCRRPPSS